MTDGTMLWGGEHQGSGSGERAEFGLGLVECEVVRSGNQVDAREAVAGVGWRARTCMSQCRASRQWGKKNP